MRFAKKKIKVIFVVPYVWEGEFLGIGIMSSLLKNNNYEVDISEPSLRNICGKLNDRSFFYILAYSTIAESALHYLKINRIIKNKYKNVISIFGGAYATNYPEMIYKDGVDAVCIGEGEYPLLDFVKSIREDRMYGDIPNLWIKVDGRIIKNPLRSPIDNLDELPFADRDIFRKLPFFVPGRMTMQTSRGCPYKCSYCYNNYLRYIYGEVGFGVKRRSVESVIKEIVTYKRRYPLKFVIFWDDIFILSKDWIKRFSREYKKHVNVPFYCNVRADMVNEEVVYYLKMAGCYSVSMGIEVADDVLRNGLLRKNITKKDITRACRIFVKYDVKLRTTNILGITDNIQKDLETLDFNIENKVKYSVSNILYFLPKVPISCFIFERNNRKYIFSGIIDKRVLQKALNLHFLFGLLVRFSCLRHFANLLIRLPLGRLYYVVWFLWELVLYSRLHPYGGMAALIRRTISHSRFLVRTNIFSFRYTEE